MSIIKKAIIKPLIEKIKKSETEMLFMPHQFNYKEMTDKKSAEIMEKYIEDFEDVIVEYLKGGDFGEEIDIRFNDNYLEENIFYYELGISLVDYTQCFLHTFRDFEKESYEHIDLHEEDYLKYREMYIQWIEQEIEEKINQEVLDQIMNIKDWEEAEKILELNVVI